MAAGHARCSCMPSMTSGTPDDSCARMITSRFLSETETRGISRKRRPLEMSPSRVHPAEVRKGPGGIFLDEKQIQCEVLASVAVTCSSSIITLTLKKSYQSRGAAGTRSQTLLATPMSSSSSPNDPDIWEFVSCSKCYLPFLSGPSALPQVPFWLTECGHVICNIHLSKSS